MQNRKSCVTKLRNSLCNKVAKQQVANWSAQMYDTIQQVSKVRVNQSNKQNPWKRFQRLRNPRWRNLVKHPLKCMISRQRTSRTASFNPLVSRTKKLQCNDRTSTINFSAMVISSGENIYFQLYWEMHPRYQEPN